MPGRKVSGILRYPLVSLNMCLTLSRTLQKAHTDGELNLWTVKGCVWAGCGQLSGKPPQPPHSRQSKRRPSWDVLLGSHLAACCPGSGSRLLLCGQDTMTDSSTTVKKLSTPNTSTPGIVASLATASAVSLPQIPTWSAIHAKIILKFHLQRVYVENSCKTSGWMKSGDYRPCIAIICTQ
jgi:hypothetical protein